MEFGQKKIHEIDLFDFTSFFALDLFNFLAHCDVVGVTNGHFILGNGLDREVASA